MSNIKRLRAAGYRVYWSPMYHTPALFAYKPDTGRTVYGNSTAELANRITLRIPPPPPLSEAASQAASELQRRARRWASRRQAVQHLPKLGY